MPHSTGQPQHPGESSRDLGELELTHSHLHLFVHHCGAHILLPLCAKCTEQADRRHREHSHGRRALPEPRNAAVGAAVPVPTLTLTRNSVLLHSTSKAKSGWSAPGKCMFSHSSGRVGMRQNKTKHPLTLRKGQGLKLTRVSAVQDEAWTDLEWLEEEQGAKPQGLGKVSTEGCRTDVLGGSVPSLSPPPNSLQP